MTDGVPWADRPLRILHFAVTNVAGAPGYLAGAQRARGHDARLVTFSHRAFERRFGYETDIRLLYPDPRLWLERLGDPGEPPETLRAPLGAPDYQPPVRDVSALYWLALRLRDVAFMPLFLVPSLQHRLLDFDVYHLHGGSWFFDAGWLLGMLKRRGKHVVVHYYGDDLRTRGAIASVEQEADVVLTGEFDHLLLRDDLRFCPMPYEPGLLPPRATRPGGPFRVGHAPTNRNRKGTEHVERAIEALRETHAVEFQLIRGVPHAEALSMKATCDVFIDSLSEVGGYGANSLEALAMGIPTCTRLPPAQEAALPGHPFVVVEPDTLAARLRELADDPDYRTAKGEQGAAWVEQAHSAAAIARGMDELYAAQGWWPGAAAPDAADAVLAPA
jgi:glycosyltransferase involved in cell wall biosynthesis